MATIDFNKIHEVAMRGFRRAAIFMGLGVNAAADDRLIDYSLTKHSTIRLVPTDQPAEVVAEFKDEFGRWVVANGLRELLESFETFLSRLYDACLFAEVKVGRISPADAKKADKQFDHAGLGEKVKLLKAKGIAGAHSQHLPSLYGIRNCLTHRQGRVKEKDCNDPATPGCIVATWWACDIEAHTNEGEERPMTQPFNGPMLESVYFPTGGHIVLRVTERRLVVPAGTSLRLTTAQLAEICQFVAMESGAYVNSAVDYLENTCGIARQLPSESTRDGSQEL